MGRILLTVLCVIAVTDGFVNEIDEPDVFTLQKELTAVKSQVTQLQQLVHTLNNQLSM